MPEGYSHNPEIAGVENAESAEQALGILRNSENFKDSENYGGPQFSHSLVEGQWLMAAPGKEPVNKTEEKQKEGGEAWEEHQQIIKGLTEKGFHIILKKSSEVHSGGEIAKASYDEKFYATIYQLNGQQIEITAFDGTQKEFKDKFGKESWFDDMLDYDDNDDTIPSSLIRGAASLPVDIFKSSAGKQKSAEAKQSAWDSFWDNLLKPSQQKLNSNTHEVQKPGLMDIFGLGTSSEQAGAQLHTAAEEAVIHQPVEDIFSLFVPHSPALLATDGPFIKSSVQKTEAADLLPETSFFESIITLELPSSAPATTNTPAATKTETEAAPAIQLDVVDGSNDDDFVTKQPISLVQTEPVVLDKSMGKAAPASREVKAAEPLNNQMVDKYQAPADALPSHAKAIQEPIKLKQELSNNIIVKPALQDKEKAVVNRKEEPQNQDITIFQEPKAADPLYIEGETAESAKQQVDSAPLEQGRVLAEAPHIIKQTVLEQAPLPAIPPKDIQNFNTNTETAPLESLALGTAPVMEVVGEEMLAEENQGQVEIEKIQADDIKEPKMDQLAIQDVIVTTTESPAAVLANDYDEQASYSGPPMESELPADETLLVVAADTTELTDSVELTQTQFIQNQEASPAPQVRQETSPALVAEMPVEIPGQIIKPTQEPRQITKPSNVVTLEKTVIHAAPMAKELISVQPEIIEINEIADITSVNQEIKTLSEPLPITIHSALQETKPAANKIVEKQQLDNSLEQPTVIDKALAKTVKKTSAKPILHKLDIKPATVPKHTEKPRLEKSIVRIREEISALREVTPKQEIQHKTDAKQQSPAFKAAPVRQSKVTTLRRTSEHRVYVTKEKTSTQKILNTLASIKNQQESRIRLLAVMAENLRSVQTYQNNERSSFATQTSSSGKQQQRHLTRKRAKEFSYINPLTATRQPLQAYSDDVNTSQQQAISLKMAA